MSVEPDRNEAEEALEPHRAIIDPHLHLWDIPATPGGLQEAQTFLIREAADTIRISGHRVTHTVFVECHAMYRQDGPPELRSLGETEFANGMAAMAGSGRYGPSRIAHRIVANLDLCAGEAVASIIAEHRQRAGERLCGVRMNTAFSEAGLFGAPAEPHARTRLASLEFVQGARALAAEGLTLDVWCLHPQLPQVLALALAVPDLVIVLNHAGTPDLRGRYLGQERAAFSEWRQHLEELAALSNIRVKISGLGMDVTRALSARTGTASSQRLADAWGERFESVIAAFGCDRCMFASNYPADRSAGSYGAIWNAFKRLAGSLGEGEKDRLFRLTAAQTYNIDPEI